VVIITADEIGLEFSKISPEILLSVSDADFHVTVYLSDGLAEELLETLAAMLGRNVE